MSADTMDPKALPWQFLKGRTRLIVKDANGGGPLFIIEGGYNAEAVAMIEKALRLPAPFTLYRAEETMSEVVYSGYCTYCKTPLHPEKQTREALSDMMREHVAVCEKHPARALERENAALREAALKAVHTIGKALHGEGKDFRDLDHTYKLLIDLLPAEVLSQDTAQAKVPGRPCEHGVPLLEHCEICDGGEK